MKKNIGKTKRRKNLNIPNSQIIREVGRVIAGAYYDMQEIRLSNMNRIRGIVRAKVEGISQTEPESKKEKKTYESKYTDEEVIKMINSLEKVGNTTKDEADFIKQCFDMVLEGKKLENIYKSA